MFKVFERLLRDKIATEPISFEGSDRFRGPIAGKGELTELRIAKKFVLSVLLRCKLTIIKLIIVNVCFVDSALKNVRD